MNKKQMVEFVMMYESRSNSASAIYLKCESKIGNIEKVLIDLQHESMALGFISAMKLIEDTPLADVKDLVSEILKNND